MKAKDPQRGRKRNDAPETAPERGWRLFLAVPLTEAVAAQVASLTSDLATLNWPVRWVRPEAAHITLHFLGDTAPERAELLRLALPAAVASISSFSLTTAQLGVFPNSRRPRVIWLGLDDPAHRLAQVHEALASTLRSLGFPVEDRRFSPHITLGRVREAPATDAERLAASVQHHLTRQSELLSPLPLPVNEVILFRSVLSRDGARYTPLVHAKFA